MRHGRRPRSERGAVLVHVAIGLTALLAFSAFAIDFGIMWVSRSQAQSAADAGALAGAVALSYDDYSDRTPGGPAVMSATTIANANRVWGASPGVTAANVSFPPFSAPFNAIPDCLNAGDGCVRVDVFRNQANGNPLPTIFGQLAQVMNQGVRATAVAQVAIGNAVNCLKPWAVADKWTEVNPVPKTWDPSDTFDRFDRRGVQLPGDPSTLDSYTAGVDGFRPEVNGTRTSDYGLQLTLKLGDPNDLDQLQSGWFQPLALPGSVGGNDYRNNIASCAPVTVVIGEDLEIDEEPGNMIGPTKQGVADLVAKDPGASWDTTNRRVIGSAYTTSPRIVPVPLFDVQEFLSRDPNGRSYITVTNIMGFFIEGMSGNDVLGRLMPLPGLIVSGAGPTNPNSFVRVIRLVR